LFQAKKDDLERKDKQILQTRMAKEKITSFQTFFPMLAQVQQQLQHKLYNFVSFVRQRKRKESGIKYA
jgi:hypothetical protein